MVCVITSVFSDWPGNWSIEPLPAIGIIFSAVLYLNGAARLARRNRAWPKRRTLPFFAGLAVISIATLSPLAAQDDRLFSAHVVQHLLLSMAGPALICLGAPITLCLQASGRSTQQRILKVLHSKPSRFLTFPLVSWSIFVGTLFVLYFSGLYALSLRNNTFHEFVHIHFVFVGFLFFSPVVAIDPHPWRMPHGARLLYVGLTLPAHAFLALALLSATEPLAAHWYLATTGRSLDEILADQKVGAGIMWVAGDLIAICTVGIVATQWAADDERSAAREDRYNDLVSQRAISSEPA